MSGNKKISWSRLSKIVGWEGITVEYPTLEEVDDLIKRAEKEDVDAMVELFRYFRFLKCARSDNQREVMGKIIDAMFIIRKKYL